MGRVINEGVSYNPEAKSFSFDFDHDFENDIIKLEKQTYSYKLFNQCYYYGYKFTDDVDSKLRTEFIHSLKFPDGHISEKDKNQFIINAVDSLDDDIRLHKYSLVIYPESLSELNRDMFRYLSAFTSPELASIELVKELPKNIEFDFDNFKLSVLDSKLSNGRPRYTEKQKAEVIENINKMMDEIHNLDYFSIARNVKNQKYKPFFKNYYKFKTEENKKLFEKIENNTNVLVIDDILTSGTTISLLLKCLKTINDSNKIVVFSLIGKDR